MGKYIDENSKGEFIGTSFDSKVSSLLNDGGSKISKPDNWEEGLVCVVDNIAFAAAGYAYDEFEMNEFKSIDGRRTQWIKLLNAKELAN